MEPVTTDSATEVTWREDQVDGTYHKVELYCSALTFTIGILANGAILALLHGAYFRRTCALLLLVTLTVCDFVLLMTISLRWFVLGMTNDDLDIASLGHLGCMIFHHISHVAQCLSSWTLLLITVERVFAIHLIPAGMKSLSPRHLQLSLVIIGSVLLVINIHWYWNIYNITKTLQASSNCPFFNFPGFNEAWWWFDLTLTDLLPMFLILVATCSLTAKLGFALINKTAIVHSSSINNFSNFESQVTALSIALSYFYILTTLPTIIVRLGESHWDLSENNKQLLEACILLFKLIYSSCKLPLYLCIGKKSYKSLFKAACNNSMSEKRRQTIKAITNNIDDSDQLTSKGLSHSTQGSLRAKGEKLEELLNHLEQTSRPETPTEMAAEDVTTPKEGISEESPAPATVKVTDDLPQMPKMKLSSRRKRLFKQEKVSHESDEPDSDLGSSVSSYGIVPHDRLTELADQAEECAPTSNKVDESQKEN